MNSGSSTDIYGFSIEEFRQTRFSTFRGKRLVVGAAVFNSSSQLLLLQRSASEDAYPLMYEIPGGHVDEDDLSIAHTVGRELKEETGLNLERIIAEFDGFEYGSSKAVTAQLNFLVEVAESDPQVVTNPAEHQAFAWVSSGKEDAYQMTDAMRVVVKDAFKCHAEVEVSRREAKGNLDTRNMIKARQPQK